MNKLVDRFNLVIPLQMICMESPHLLLDQLLRIWYMPFRFGRTLPKLFDYKIILIKPLELRPLKVMRILMTTALFLCCRLRICLFSSDRLPLILISHPPFLAGDVDIVPPNAP